jgi:hypothetical protein
MTAEQAARLLEGLAEEELESMRKLALQRVIGSSEAREKDW